MLGVVAIPARQGRAICDRAAWVSCPLCRNFYAVRPDRLATDEEIPIAPDALIGGAAELLREKQA